jgi:hypothetical protein
MFNNQLKTFLLNLAAHPLVLALPFTLVFIWFLPNPTTKYRADLVENRLSDKVNSELVFYDLNNDGNDEQIESFHNPVKKKASIKILSPEGLGYDQWNFNGHFSMAPHFHCADLNSNGFAEIYAFYYRDDSVFMSVFEPYADKLCFIHEMLVSTVEKREGAIDYSVSNFVTADIDLDGFDELIFNLKGGYSRQPRSVVRFDLQKKQFTHAKSTGIYYTHVVQHDFDGNSIPEFYFGSSAPGNIHDSLNIPYSDYSAWLTGYNHQLQSLFPPVECKGMNSTTYLTKYINNQGKTFLAVQFASTEDYTIEIVFYDSIGHIHSNRLFEFDRAQWKKADMPLTPINYKGKSCLILKIINGVVTLTDENFNLKEVSIDERMGFIYTLIDLDKDGILELLSLNYSSGKLLITNESLTQPIAVTVKNNIDGRSVSVGMKKFKNQPNQLYVEVEDNLSFYTYRADWMYYLKYPLWLLIYAIVSLVFWLAQQLQTLQNQRKQRIEDTINSLRMRTLKSQMDPHFMFNVLNGLAINISSGNNSVAYDQLIRFSKMLRSLINKEGSLHVSLREELEFARNYLELEKFRFQEDLNFSFVIDENVDLNRRFPRMLLQLQVENAIKHGLHNKLTDKKMWITAHCREEKILLVIEDNGIGRKAAAKYTRDPGNGLNLTAEMIQLHKKMGGGEITHHIVDLYNATGEATGTKIEILF